MSRVLSLSAHKVLACLSAFCTAVVSVFWSAQVWAVGSLGDMANNLKSEFTSFGPMLKAGFALGGFFLVGLGLWQLYARSQQPGQPKGGALMAILIGVCLLAASAIAQMTSGSLGTGDPALGELGIS